MGQLGDFLLMQNTREIDRMAKTTNLFVEDVLFFSVNILKAVAQVAFGLYDQTHYHISAFKLHCSIAIGILWHYLRSIPKHFLAHWKHERVLHTMGMGNVQNLMDTGSLVWRPLPSDGNLLNSKPADRVTGLLNNSSGNPAHLSLSASSFTILWNALENIPEFAYEQSVFLDFGCGTGLPLLAAMTKPFHTIVGVELDAKCAELARENIAFFSAPRQQRSVAIRGPSATVRTMDMSDFDYNTLRHMSQDGDGDGDAKACAMESTEEKASAKDHSNVDTGTEEKHTIVLYMYEPLWTIRKADAHVIYSRILHSAQQSGYPVLVAYFYCGMYNGDALPALAELGAHLLFTCKYDSLNFGTESDFLLYKLC